MLKTRLPLRSVMIVATGIYLIVLSCLVSLSLLLRYSHSRPLRQAGDYLILRKIGVLCFGLGLLLTGISLIRRKQWARYSLLILSALALFQGLLLLGGFFIFPAISPEPYYIRYPYKIIIFSFWSVFYFVIPLLCLIYFTRKSVSELFTGSIYRPGGRPLGVFFLTVLTALGALVSAGNVLFKSPSREILISGIFIPFVFVRVYLIIICALSATASVGLWLMKRSGWICAAVLQIFQIIVAAAMCFSMSDYNIAMQFALIFNINDFTRIPYGLIRMFSITTILIPFSILIYLINRRDLFRKE